MSKLNLIVHPKTIYTDIVGMPDPLLLGITIHYFNHSDTALFMKIFVTGPSPWTAGNSALGSLASGANTYVNLDNITSRTLPVAATTEILTLTLRGYSDAGYSVLEYEFSRSLTVIFIKSNDGTWTTDFSDNFDDGTVDGWAWESIVDATAPDFNPNSDYLLSAPFALRAYRFKKAGAPDGEAIIRFYKSFTTPNSNTVYAIFNIRLHPELTGGTDYGCIKYIEITEDATILVYLGKAFDTTSSTYIPSDKWLRIVVPVTKNATIKLGVLVDIYSAGGYTNQPSFWLDDFLIISK